MILLPVSDENSYRGRPWVTYGLILANIAVFILAVHDGPKAYALVLRRHGAYAHLVHPESLCYLLAKMKFAVFFRALGSLFTSIFLHAGLAHLAGNMLFLAIVGDNVEMRLGRLRYLAWYLLWGVGATWCFAWFAPPSRLPLVGASGAISGVMGAYLVLFPANRVKFFYWFILLVGTFRIRAIFAIGLWIAEQAMLARYAAGPGASLVAFHAHLGGAILGMLFALGLPLLERKRTGSGQRK